jgi:hypothetical protein
MEDLKAKFAFFRKDAESTIEGQYADQQLANIARQHAGQVIWLLDRFENPPRPRNKGIFLVKGNMNQKFEMIRQIQKIIEQSLSQNASEDVASLQAASTIYDEIVKPISEKGIKQSPPPSPW